MSYNEFLERNGLREEAPRLPNGDLMPVCSYKAVYLIAGLGDKFKSVAFSNEDSKDWFARFFPRSSYSSVRLLSGGLVSGASYVKAWEEAGETDPLYVAKDNSVIDTGQTISFGEFLEREELEAADFVDGWDRDLLELLETGSLTTEINGIKIELTLTAKLVKDNE